MDVVEWPSRSLTTFRSTPAARAEAGVGVPQV